MKFLNIEFVPLNKPLHRRIETFWVGFWSVMFIFGFVIFTLPLLYLCFTQFWWISLLIFIWNYLDRETCEKGGRSADWMQNWSCWRHFKNYFNSELLYDDEFNLDSKRNYLFCCFPHGIIPVGAYSNLLIKPSQFRQRYPNINPKISTLTVNFFVPILRDIWLGLNFISCSSRSLSYALSRPEGGTIVMLAVGGAEESIFSNPGKYKVVVKNRKGFVKIALKTGAPLVPAITFRENDVFQQIENSTLRKFQNFVKKYTGVVPIIFNGRGLFQYSFGVIPRRRKMVTVLGKPVDVQKVGRPTQDQIDDLHSRFAEKLEELFDKYKYKCLENPQDVHLEIY